MKSFTTRRFRAQLSELPDDVRELTRKQYKIFAYNPNHPSVKFKQVWRNPPIFSARIGIHYRTLARADGDNLIWFWIGSHADYDKLLKRF